MNCTAQCLKVLHFHRYFQFKLLCALQQLRFDLHMFRQLHQLHCHFWYLQHQVQIYIHAIAQENHSKFAIQLDKMTFLQKIILIVSIWQLDISKIQLSIDISIRIFMFK
jgi:hypothetical protein